MSNGLPSRQVPNSYVLYEQVAYNEFWDSPSRQKLDQLEHAIVNELLPQKGHRIIDMGCGYGRLADCYIHRFDTAIMFDGSLSLLKIARNKTEAKAIYIWGDVNHLPFCEAAFDSALMIRTLHHVPNIDAFLRQVRRILCASGNLILNYSNKRNAFRVIRFLTGFASHSPFTFEPLAIEPNFIHYHPGFISEKLSSSGFSVSLYRGAGMIDKLASLLGPFWQVMPPGVCAAPVLGKSLLAPWIFCKGTTDRGSTLKRTSRVEELLICPSCGSRLINHTHSFNCPSCCRKYPVIDGIIDMRPATGQE